MGNRRKVYDNLLSGTIVILFFLGIGFLGSIVRRYPLFLPGILLCCIVLAFLLYKQGHGFSNDTSPPTVQRDLLVLTITSVFFAFLSYFYYSKNKAYVEKLFLDGMIRKERVFTNISTDEVPQYETKYSFETDNGVMQTCIQIVYFFIIYGTPIVVFYLYNKTRKNSSA